MYNTRLSDHRLHQLERFISSRPKPENEQARNKPLFCANGISMSFSPTQTDRSKLNLSPAVYTQLLQHKFYHLNIVLCYEMGNPQIEKIAHPVRINGYLNSLY